jgi:hypothetical protein
MIKKIQIYNNILKYYYYLCLSPFKPVENY